jgi:hypothetical protein
LLWEGHILFYNIFSKVIQTGNTYVFYPDTPKEFLNNHWFDDKMETFVALDNNNEIVGT